MKKSIIFFLSITMLAILASCQSVSKKIDEKTEKEKISLSKWLNQTETELKTAFGNPDKVEFKDNSRNRYYVYMTKKLKIKCERKFEINQNNMVVGFSSKNCF